MIYESMVLGPSIKKLIELGDLVPPQYYAPSTPDLEGMKIRMGDYRLEDLEERVDRVELVGDIVENWARICPDRITVVFATSVKHSRHIKERFIDAGIRCEHLDGETPKQERDEILKKLACGEIQVVTNCMVLNEGWDCPPVSCVILARPTKSLTMYIQMAGRVLRPAPDKINALILDHGGLFYQHGSIMQDQEWSLEFASKKEIKEKEKRELKARKENFITCEECKFIYEGLPNCPKCGWVPIKKGREFVTQDGLLGRIDHNGVFIPQEINTDEEKKLFYSQLEFLRIQRNFKEGWTGCNFKERFGHWPSNEIKGEAKRANTEVKAWVKKQELIYKNKKRAEKKEKKEWANLMEEEISKNQKAKKYG